MSNIYGKFYDSTNIPESKLKDLKDLIEAVEEERYKFTKNQTFIDCILEAAKMSYGIPEITCFKIRDIVLRYELIRDFLPKDLPQEEIEEYLKIALRYNEQKALQLAVEQKITEKYEELSKELSLLTETDERRDSELIENIRFDVIREQNNLINLKKGLQIAQNKYFDAMREYREKLQTLHDIKTKEAPEVMTEKAKEVALNTEKFDLKIALLEQYLKLLMFGDTLPTDVYHSAYKDLQKQQEECRKELEKLTGEKEKYEEIAKTEEFQNILSEFKQYKKGLDKKKWIYNEIVNKVE